jgi:hypothetical protein
VPRDELGREQGSDAHSREARRRDESDGPPDDERQEGGRGEEPRQPPLAHRADGEPDEPADPGERPGAGRRSEDVEALRTGEDRVEGHRQEQRSGDHRGDACHADRPARAPVARKESPDRDADGSDDERDRCGGVERGDHRLERSEQDELAGP